MRNFLEIDDLSHDEILQVLDLAALDDPPAVLARQSVALVFEKPSLRTRNSTEAAITQLGGHPVSMVGGEAGIDTRESAEDIARTLAGYHAFIGARVFDHSVLARMVRALSDSSFAVPIINLLSDDSHPCQTLADLLTIRNHFGLQPGLRLCYVGDSNNVTRSLVIGCLMMDIDVAVASPKGYSFSNEERERLQAMGSVTFHDEPRSAVRDRHVVYTDVWTSMGREEERLSRVDEFKGFTVDEDLLSLAKDEVIVMHCLPAHDGEEIARSVLESSASVVWEQAQNRMKAMKGLFLFMSDAGPRS